MSWKFVRGFTGDFDWWDGIFFIRDHLNIRIQNEKKNRNIIIQMTPEEAEEYGKYLLKAAERARKIMKNREARRKSKKVEK